jgi:hypothetical protein
VGEDTAPVFDWKKRKTVKCHRQECKFSAYGSETSKIQNRSANHFDCCLRSFISECYLIFKHTAESFAVHMLVTSVLTVFYERRILSNITWLGLSQEGKLYSWMRMNFL